MTNNKRDPIRVAQNKNKVRRKQFWSNPHFCTYVCYQYFSTTRGSSINGYTAALHQVTSFLRDCLRKRVKRSRTNLGLPGIHVYNTNHKIRANRYSKLAIWVNHTDTASSPYEATQMTELVTQHGSVSYKRQVTIRWRVATSVATE
jgi:hypothetical protein